MATVKFLYRSTREVAPLTLRLSFRNGLKDHVIESKTQIVCNKQDWKLLQNSRRIKDARLKNKKIEFEKETIDVESYVLTAFNNSNQSAVDKLWLQNQLDSYYGKNDTEIISDKILKYFEKYLELIENNITKTTLTRYNTSYKFTKCFIDESECYNQNTIISDIDVDFYNKFRDYGLDNKYSLSTINKYFSAIKTMCNYAYAHHGIQLSHRYNLIKMKANRMPVVYLTMDELKLIGSLKSNQLGSRLDNVRDWLLISCLTGQRISDFMNFSTDNIREVDGIKLMDIFQEKGKKSVTIPILDQVIEIMKKYNGGFPKQLSDQKYNDYVKEVVKLAGIDEVIYGGVVKVIPDKGKRKVMGNYPKYELISSHVGRRSFATNFYGRMKTPWLMNITGHVKESTFLAYIGKTSKDTAIEAAREFKKLNIEL
jgi:integrase